MVILVSTVRGVQKKSNTPEILKQAQNPTHLNILGKGIATEHES